MNALVTGAVVRADNRVRVTAQLINAANEEQLWADRYDREFRDVISLQGEIVSALAREIKLQLSPREQARLKNRQTIS